MTFQDLILKLSTFWASRGCLLQQPLDLEVGARHGHLTRQARLCGQTPGLVEHVVFGLLGRRQRVQPLAHDHVTGRAGARQLARVLDLDAVLQQRATQVGARFDVELESARTEMFMGQDRDLGHDVIWGMIE